MKILLLKQFIKRNRITPCSLLFILSSLTLYSSQEREQKLTLQLPTTIPRKPEKQGAKKTKPPKKHSFLATAAQKQCAACTQRFTQRKSPCEKHTGKNNENNMMTQDEKSKLYAQLLKEENLKFTFE